ncbi:MAG: hypothetical protein WC955_06375 [Elusimicrobiota bacterium]
MTQEPTNETEYIVEESKETFSTWIDRPYIPNELKTQLFKANVLIVPREGFREHSEPVFPTGTEELLNFLRDNMDKGIVPDICSTDQDYREFALHDTWIIIGSFIVTSIVAPIIVDLISEYIKKRWTSKENHTNIKVELTVVEKDGHASRLLYEGSANDFNKSVKPTLKSLADKNVDTQPIVGTQPKKEISR